jgi:hypothetical protein
VIDLGEIRPLDTSWFDGDAELDTGARGPADPSARLQRSLA